MVQLTESTATDASHATSHLNTISAIAASASAATATNTIFRKPLDAVPVVVEQTAINSPENPPNKEEELLLLDISTKNLVHQTCLMNKKKAKCPADTGAVVTVVKVNFLPGRTSKASRLKLKGVNKGTSSLYGPRWIEFDFGPIKTRYPVYEGHIEDDCLIGADLLDYLNATASIHECLLTINRSGPNHYRKQYSSSATWYTHLQKDVSKRDVCTKKYELQKLSIWLHWQMLLLSLQSKLTKNSLSYAEIYLICL